VNTRDSAATGRAAGLGGKWLIRGWIVILVAIVTVTGYITIATTGRYRAAAHQLQRAQMDSALPEAEFVPTATGLTTNPQASQVKVGIYLTRIVDLSIPNDTWTADFYIWFNWTDESLNPGETFEVMNGQILSREKQDEYVTDNQHYATYRVIARFTQFFDVALFPLDDHLLTIGIEDGTQSEKRLRYVADTQNAGVSPAVRIPGFTLAHSGSVVKSRMFATTFGDPRLSRPEDSIYSHYRFGIYMNRHRWEMYTKVFLALTAAVFVSLLAFFIKPSHMEARFSVRVGAFFGAVTATIASSSLVPDTGMLTLTDMVNATALVTILLSLVQTAIAFHMYHTGGEESLATALDRVSLLILTLGYVAINVAIPVVASS
jgi:hypothetical protein